MLYPNDLILVIMKCVIKALHCIMLLNLCLNEMKFACNLLLSGIMLINFLSDALII